MPVAPTPSEIFHRAAEEGERRLDQSTLELVATSFIAGFTIVFGIVALGIVYANVEPLNEGLATLASALAFGVGLMFLIVGRVELFSENFFDPIATAVEQSNPWMGWRLLRLWGGTFVFNFVGGVLFILVLSVDGALPPGTADALSKTALESVNRDVIGGFANAIAGGALVALLSHLLVAVDNVGSRIAVAYSVGFLLALGPFNHVIVTGLHVFFGLLVGAAISTKALTLTIIVATVGNIVGGIGLVTLSHLVQVKGAREPTN